MKKKQAPVILWVRGGKSEKKIIKKKAKDAGFTTLSGWVRSLVGLDPRVPKYDTL